MVAEWADDQAKSGVYQQALKNPAEPGQMPVTSVIPAVKLENATGVIETGLLDVRRGRLLYRAVHTPLEKLYESAELKQLRDVYDKLNGHPADYGEQLAMVTAMLSELELQMPESDLEALIKDLISYRDLENLAGARAKMSKENQAITQAFDVSFEFFAKLVAVMVEQQSQEDAEAGR